MDLEPQEPYPSQPALFAFSEATVGYFELFPALWGAAEDLVSNHAAQRLRALERIEQIGAGRLSPLVAYLLSTRLSDPDLSVRSQAIRLVAEVLSRDQNNRMAPELVRQRVRAHINQMRTREIYGMLQAAAKDLTLEADVTRLLSGCPYAGNHLTEILGGRKTPVAIRRSAIRMIGQVGYLEAMTALDRMAARLEARLNGQSTLPFAGSSNGEDLELLPEIHSTLALLRAI
jgi:HEAT repeat protein